MITPIFKDYTAIIIGTGPSLTPDVISRCKQAQKDGAKLFGVNLAYTVLDVDVLHACNYQFYDHYYPIDERLRDPKILKWTTRPQLEGKYEGVEYIEERWEDGLSTNPAYINAHHGSSAQVMNLALHYGITRMVLVGFDMRFPGKVSDKEYKDKRHFHTETPLTSKHWPRTGPEGQLDGLIREFETIHPEDYAIRIINTTMDSAMKCFEFMELDDALTTS